MLTISWGCLAKDWYMRGKILQLLGRFSRWSAVKATALPTAFRRLNPGLEASLALATHDLVALNTLGRVARVYHQLRLLHDPAIVVFRMIGHDDHAIVLSEILQRGTFHLQIIFAALSDRGEKRIVIADLGPFFLQQFDDRQGRRFAQVVNITLVRHAQHEHTRSV